jgi:hypothetical protein
MLPYASKYRFLLNICRYSCVSGRPFLPRSRRMLSTTAASCIAHASWPGAIHRLCPFALWTVISGLQIGRTSPGDYYGHSVAIGLASLRRSHVHNCHT